MAIDSIEATGGLGGGGSSGDVSVYLNPPMSRQNGGTGVSAVTTTQLVNQLGAVPTSGGTMSGNLIINHNTAALPTATGPGDPPFWIGGADGAAVVPEIDAFGAPTILHIRRANGSYGATPALTPLANGDQIFGIVAHGYDGSNYTPGRAAITFNAAEAWSLTAQGAIINFLTTTLGQATGQTQRMQIGSGIVVGAPGGAAPLDKGPGTINCQELYVNGSPIGGSSGLPLTGGTLTGPLIINQNATALPDPLGMAGNVFPLRLAAPDGQGLHMYFDSFGNGGGIHFRRAGGTNAGRAALVNNDQLGFLTFHGYDGSAYTGGQSSIGVFATGTWSTTNHGTEMRFQTTQTGQTGNVVRMTINGDGDVVIPGDLIVSGTLGPPSDRRVKKNIEPYERGLDAIRELNPITFQYNGLGGTPDDGRTRYGLDADNTNEVIPEMVSTLTSHEVDGVPIKAIAPLTLIFTLTNAVKELAARLETLERSK